MALSTCLSAVSLSLSVSVCLCLLPLPCCVEIGANHQSGRKCEGTCGQHKLTWQTCEEKCKQHKLTWHKCEEKVRLTQTYLAKVRRNSATSTRLVPGKHLSAAFFLSSQRIAFCLTLSMHKRSQTDRLCHTDPQCHRQAHRQTSTTGAGGGPPTAWPKI